MVLLYILYQLSGLDHSQLINNEKIYQDWQKKCRTSANKWTDDQVKAVGSRWMIAHPQRRQLEVYGERICPAMEVLLLIVIRLSIIIVLYETLNITTNNELKYFDAVRYTKHCPIYIAFFLSTRAIVIHDNVNFELGSHFHKI